MERIVHSPARTARATHESPAGTSVGYRFRSLDRVRVAVRTRHYSRRTEKAYVAWTRRFVLFHGKRHPAQLGASDVEAFLSSLATERHVAASTQNQALAAIVFLYREVLDLELPQLAEVVRAKRPLRLPTVLRRDDVARVLAQMSGTPWQDHRGRFQHRTSRGTTSKSITDAPGPVLPMIPLAQSDEQCAYCAA